MLKFILVVFFCWMFLPERVEAAPLPSTGTWSHMPAAGDRERQLNRSMNESNLQTWMQINLYLQQDLTAPEAVFTCWSILEIWGIACTLPAQKIATLIYLQPLGNMKGGKKSMNDAQLHLPSESSRTVFSKQYPWPHLCLIIAFAAFFFFNCLCFCYLSAQERSFLTKEKPTQFEMKGWHIPSNDKPKSRAWYSVRWKLFTCDNQAESNFS